MGRYGAVRYGLNGFGTGFEGAGIPCAGFESIGRGRCRVGGTVMEEQVCRGHA